ncbi:MAG: arginase family protein [bacterium]|nr:arginase family protein [bacterium]
MPAMKEAHPHMPDRFIVTPFFLDEAYSQLEALGLDCYDANKQPIGHGDQIAAVSPLLRGLSDLVCDAVRRGERPVSISGDCCSAIAVLAGLQRAGTNPTLIWFDAHGDFNTWETTPSGFLGGMPLAMIVGRGEQRLVEAAGLVNLPERQVVLTDARDLDPGEREALARSSVRHVGDVRALLEGDLPEGPLYVHFDTDVVNPLDAPAQNYLAQGGPAASQLAEVFALLAHTTRVVAISVSSWNPNLDEDGRTKRVCMELLDVLRGSLK